MPALPEPILPSNAQFTNDLPEPIRQEGAGFLHEPPEPILQDVPTVRLTTEGKKLTLNGKKLILTPGTKI